MCAVVTGWYHTQKPVTIFPDENEAALVKPNKLSD